MTASDVLIACLVAIPIILILAIIVAILIWLWRDANRHGQPGWVWVLLTLWLGFPLLIWLIVRSSTFVKPPGTTSNG